jgi:hypothetical protein
MKTLKSTLTLALAAAALAIGLAACDQVGKITPTIKFNSEDYVKATEATFVLPPQTTAGEFGIDTILRTKYVLSAIEKTGYKLTDFKSIILTSANLAIISENTTFDPFVSAGIYVGDDTPGSTYAQASATNSEKDGKKELPLKLTEATTKLNLLDLFKSDVIPVKATALTNDMVQEETSMRLDYQLEIVPN